MAPEISGANDIKGHLAGSRRYGSHTRTSDWDFSFEDCPAVRAFLIASGFKLITEFKPGERGNSTSYWKHRYYNCEVFLTFDNEIKQDATKIVRWLQWSDILHDKLYRIRVWSAIELCLSTLWAIRTDYLAAKAKRDEEGFSLRDYPVK
jgi:hypothetical protein